MLMLRNSFCLLSCSLVLLAAGCGDGFPKRYPVSGSVKFADGSPVKTGTIELGGNGSRWTASGEIQRDGSFSLTTVKKGDGAVPGEYKVVIRQMCSPTCLPKVDTTTANWFRITTVTTRRQT